MLTQVINPIFATLETATSDTQISQGKYEDNGWYKSRNSLTTVAILILTVYTINTGVKVAAELAKHDDFKNQGRTRVIVLCFLIEIVLVLRLVMVWVANYFWYMQS